MSLENKIPKVLIVEDEIQIRFYLKAIIKSMGFEPLLANNGVQGFDILKDVRPDAIVLDIMMPERGGYLFYQDIMNHRQYCKIPILIFSGVDRKVFFHQIKMLNLNLETQLKEPEYYVAKDANPEYLKSVIQRCVVGKKSEKKSS